ncbi:unnamed protein product [Hyaloperonospora brassicae]|uniref:C2 domain-containing protein n=1 Tax=Hyaloperonospora brassicae TaxID=162125 RepID=A0AAV0TP27_HYABA|nr:unnamed protein product [Hyaloperonospora brassicae]
MTLEPRSAPLSTTTTTTTTTAPCAPPMPLFSSSKRAAAAPLCPARAVSLTAYNDSDDNTDAHVIDHSSSDSDVPPMEQLLVNHLRFAHAVRQNDAAQILQFLAKDVTLRAMDGARHDGQSAALACLVGARMTKLSSNLRVKGFPTRAGACQSTFVYEHGLVFKDPLYMEVLDWTADGASVVRIAHVPLLADAKNSKTLQDFARMTSLRHDKKQHARVADARCAGDAKENTHHKDEDDDDDEDEGGRWSSRGSRFSEGTGRSSSLCGHMGGPMRRSQRRRPKSSIDSSSSTALTAASLRLSTCSSSSSSQSGAQEVAVQPLAVGAAAAATGATSSRWKMPEVELVEISCTNLTPIRRRKTVNPFVTVQCPETKTEWKSPVMRREPNPTWNTMPLRIPVHAHAGVVEIALWDHSFFRSVKVAGAALVESDVLTNDSEFGATIQLERYDVGRIDGEPQYVTMNFRFVRRGDVPARASNETGHNTARGDASEAGKTAQQTSVRGSVLDNGLKWLVVQPHANGQHVSGLAMLFRAAVVAAMVWMLFHATLGWPKQVL